MRKAPCAADVSARFTRGDYSDVDALRPSPIRSMSRPTSSKISRPASLEAIAGKLRPGVPSLQVGQDRATEKEFIERVGARVEPVVTGRQRCRCDQRRRERLGLPLVSRPGNSAMTARARPGREDRARLIDAWESIGRQPAVAEAAVEFRMRILGHPRPIGERQISSWDLPRNEHEDGILRRSSVPAATRSIAQRDEALRASAAIAEALGHVGVLTVEFFATADGPIVNEIAPRVHNSGHWTIEGAATSQFEQHIRAICGLPLGSTARLSASASMDNLLGDESTTGRAWSPSRKMGAHLGPICLWQGRPLPIAAAAVPAVAAEVVPGPADQRGQLKIESPDGSRAIIVAPGYASQDQLSVAVNGGGQIDVRQVSAGNVSAAVNGGGRILTGRSSSLSAAINGGGEVRYAASGQVTTAIHGGGNVRRGE
jgi:5-(carboxyamino)imidazole ribonucleotide synthase